MASELATRIRSKFTSRRRRHSASPSLASSQSDGSLLYTLATPKKQQLDQRLDSPTSGQNPKPPKRGLSFLKPISQSSRSLRHDNHDGDHDDDRDQSGSDGDDEASTRKVTRAGMEEADGANSNPAPTVATVAQEASAGATSSSSSSSSGSSAASGDHGGQASGPQGQDRQQLQQQPAVSAAADHRKFNTELQPPAQPSPIIASEGSSSPTSPPAQSTAQTQSSPAPLQRQQSSYLQSIDEGSSAPASPTAAPAPDQIAGPGPDAEPGTAETRSNGQQGPSASIEAADSTARDPDALSHSHSQRRRGLDAELAIPPSPNHTQSHTAAHIHQPGPSTPLSPSSSARPQLPQRRQSLLSNRHSNLIKTLLHGPLPNDANDAGSDLQSIADIDIADIVPNMVTRKIWVRRPQASPTLITVHEDDLVDDVRDMILRKYANSLGRNFDPPDLTIRINPREQQQRERALGPEEPICRTLDAYFPGGQTVDEALIIDIPFASAVAVAGGLPSARRTPKASPRPPATVYVTDDGRPAETAEGYFPPVGGLPSPNHPLALQAPTNGAVSHSIAVLGTGQLPQIPSPGGTRTRQHQQQLHHQHQLQHRERSERPRVGRTHTSSPTVLSGGGGSNGVVASAAGAGPATASTVATANHGMQHTIHRPSHSRAQSTSSDHQTHVSQALNQQGGPPPLTNSPNIDTSSQTRVATPPPRVSSPRPSNARLKRSKRGTSEYPTLPPNMLNGGVPPINVLIVEDNPINLKLLEAFVKRLKVRWQTAMNGRDAVKKWRTGGFHLVLMDIQLPVMNGLDATREIRRLERVNTIGVFSSSPGSVPEQPSNGEVDDSDRLENLDLFKSPVIIVALTASSLQSDRHDALAAGCNDFLTKPVNFVWLERKVMEWGCMQALIDFDGWRKWKDFSQTMEQTEAAKKAASGKSKAKKKSSLSSST